MLHVHDRSTGTSGPLCPHSKIWIYGKTTTILNIVAIWHASGKEKMENHVMALEPSAHIPRAKAIFLVLPTF